MPYTSIGGLFKGREDAVAELDRRLHDGGSTAITQVHAVHGLGGVGKTRLAVEYARRAFDDGRYNTVMFVRGDTPTALDANLAALAAPHILNLPEHDLPDQPAIVDAVLRDLARRTSCLLVIDNVDTPESARKVRSDILPYFAGIHVLVTSRIANWPDGVQDMPIDKLEVADAAAYLLDKTEGSRTPADDDRAVAEQLARDLDGLPIALEQAGAYVAYRRIGFHAYLAEFAAARDTVLGWHDPNLVNYPTAVLAAWQMTERRMGADARAVLRLVSLLAPDPIPTATVEARPDTVGAAARLISDEDDAKPSGEETSDSDCRAVLADLAAWSMIDLVDTEFVIHRLVQESVRLRIPADTRAQWIRLALDLVNEHVPGDPPPDDVRSWPVWNAVEPHVAAVIDHARKAGITEHTTRLMNGLALYLNTRALFDEAEPLMRRALQIDEKSFGLDRPSVARDLNNLAQLLQATNRMDEAEPLMQRALEIFSISFGPDHPSTQTVREHLDIMQQERHGG